MSFELMLVTAHDLKRYKTMTQNAFQKGFEYSFGKTPLLHDFCCDATKGLHKTVFYA